jgi:hypothetical protein
MKNLNPIHIIKEAAIQTPLNSPEWNTLVHAALFVEKSQSEAAAKRRNANRRARHQAMTDLGLVRVHGALGGVYYE